MLFLTRRRGESVVIGTDVQITVTQFDVYQVCLGIQAPEGISIHRAKGIRPGHTGTHIEDTLYLTCRHGEAVMIGPEIEVTVLKIDVHQIRLGIEAPKGVDIHRSEVYQRIQEKRTTEPSRTRPAEPRKRIPGKLSLKRR